MHHINLVNIRKLDLNLATVFLAIWQERSVTRAGVRLALSQAAVSSALNRLRRMTQDPLFVRTKGEMTPTPHAQAMASAIEEHLGGLATCLQREDTFDPARSSRRFVIGASDDYELALGPELVKRVRSLAPRAAITFRQTNQYLVERMLDERAIEVGIVAKPPGARWIAAQEIGISGYACLLDARYCRVRLPLSMDKFLSLPHVLISYSGQTGAVDDALRRIGRRRTLMTSLTHFASVASFLKGNAAIATLPAHAAAALARSSGLQTCDAPVDLGTYAVHVVTRRDAASDQGIAWMTEQVRLCAHSIFGGKAAPLEHRSPEEPAP